MGGGRPGIGCGAQVPGQRAGVPAADRAGESFLGGCFSQSRGRSLQEMDQNLVCLSLREPCLAQGLVGQVEYGQHVVGDQGGGQVVEGTPARINAERAATEIPRQTASHAAGPGLTVHGEAGTAQQVGLRQSAAENGQGMQGAGAGSSLTKRKQGSESGHAGKVQNDAAGHTRACRGQLHRHAGAL